MKAASKRADARSGVVHLEEATTTAPPSIKFRRKPAKGSLREQHRRGDFVPFFEGRPRETLTGIPTGLPKVDEATGGLSQLNVTGGPPGSGKSTFCVQLGSRAAERGGTFLFASLEMSKELTSAMLIAHLVGAEKRDVLGGRLLASHKERLESKVDGFGDHIHVYGRAATVELAEWIQGRALLIKPKSTLLVVDSLQKLAERQHPGARTEKERLDRTTTDLTKLVDRFGLAVIAIARIPKTGPTADFHFCGSGGIDFDADVTMTIRTRKTGSSAPHIVPVELHVHKSRFGPSVAPIRLRHITNETRFEEAP